MVLLPAMATPFRYPSRSICRPSSGFRFPPPSSRVDALALHANDEGSPKSALYFVLNRHEMYLSLHTTTRTTLSLVATVLKWTFTKQATNIPSYQHIGSISKQTHRHIRITNYTAYQHATRCIDTLNQQYTRVSIF